MFHRYRHPQADNTIAEYKSFIIIIRINCAGSS